MTPTTDPTTPPNPERAADLLRLVNLAARWENQPRGHATGVTGLRDRQRAYDVFRTHQVAYRARYGDPYDPGTTIGTPARLAAWCRWVADLCRQAGGPSPDDQPADAVEKARRVVARLVSDAAESPVPSVGAAADELDAIAQWCDARTNVVVRESRAAA